MAELFAKKLAMRQFIKRVFNLMKDEYLTECSSVCCNRLKNLYVYEKARVVSVYISMPNGEFRTSSLLNDLRDQSKPMCVPKITGPNSADMMMIKTPSIDELKLTGTWNKWNILEPTVHSDTIDETYSGSIDLVIIPGVAFDRRGNRLGHGKGYYGNKCVNMSMYLKR